MKQILNHLMKEARKHLDGFSDIYLQESYFADFIANAAGGLIRHSSSWGWLVYDSRAGLFIHDDRAGKIVALYIEEMAKELIKSTFTLSDSEHRDAVVKFACKILSAKGSKSIETLLTKREPLAVAADAFDRNSWMLNCRGVAVDLRTGIQRPAVPDDLFMKCAGFRPLGCPFEEAWERAPVFTRFIREITLQNTELAEYLLSFLGYSLTGDMREQCYLNFWGAKGSNGKSTLLNLIRLIWGDYAAEAPESVVLKSAKNDARFDFQFLVGVRLVMKGDIAEGVWLNNENIKKLTGGDSFRAEKKYHDGFEFAPQCKVILSSNSRLRLSETGDALERRVRLMPFRADFRAQPDKDMPNKLRAESPAILAILIEYARRWHEREGLPESREVTDASAEYILDEDVVRQFIAEKCVRGDGETEGRADLYKAFTAWLKSNKPPSAKSFKDKMLSRGYDCKRNGKLDGLTCFFGLRLLREGEEKPPEQADLFAGDRAENRAGLTKTDELTEIPPLSESSYTRSENRKVFKTPPQTVSLSVFVSGEEKPPEQADFWTNPFDGEGG